MADVSERARILSGPSALKEEGSPEWCFQVLNALRTAFGRLDSDWAYVETLRERLREQDAWKKLPLDTDAKYGDEDTMLVDILGVDGDTLTARTLTARSAQARAQNTSPALTKDEAWAAAQAARWPAVGNVIDVSDKKPRTNAEAVTARIARDHPEIHKRMKAGEFASVAEAARAADIPYGEKPLTTLRRTWRKLTAAERKAFLAEVARD